jgi:SAM-dependent methyltransferase
VQAVDNDAALRRRLRAEGVPPGVQLVHGDGFATALPSHSLDAVHARFMVAPCGRLDELLTEMRRLVRPGGRLMLQEPIADSWAMPAAGEAWPRLKQLIRAGFKAHGGHFDAGASLQPALAQLGEVRIRQVAHVLPASHPYAWLPLHFARSLRPSWRASALADDAEIDELVAAVDRALRQPAPVTTFTLVQAWLRLDR